MRQALLALGLIACAAAPARDEVWERHAAALGGRWQLTFTYSTGDTVSGAMDLDANRSLDRAEEGIGVPTNYGTYSVRFARLGGAPSGNLAPAVVAGYSSDDSVRIRFETDRTAFSMEMRGRIAGDSVTGRWAAMQTRGTIASGAFKMVKR